MTSISIAMATYNGERFIQEQLASLAAQSILPDELVITDDGSSDATLAVAERFAESAPFPVKIKRNEARLGYSANFERAIIGTNGDIIFICDQDDAWDEDKIATVLATLSEDPSVAATVNDQRIVDISGADSGMTMFGNFRRANFPDTNMAAGSCTAFARRLLPMLLPFPTELTYDAWIGTVTDSLQLKRLIERPLQIYRRHDANASDPIVAVANPTSLSAFKRYGFADPRDGWKSECEWRAQLIIRLNDPDRIAALSLPAEVVASAIEQQQRRIDALNRRLSLLQKPRTTRWPAALSHWARGHYREFDGVRSLAKDIVRP